MPNAALKRERFPEIALLVLLFASRIAWIFCSGTSELYTQDTAEYVTLAERVLAGSFNFDLYRFVRPPWLPVQIALFKLLSPSHWETLCLLANLFFSVAGGAVLYLFCAFHLESKASARWAALIYAGYLPLFFYTRSICTEPAYVFFAILSLYCFERSLRRKSTGWAIAFSVAVFLASSYRTMILAALPIFLFAYLIAGKKVNKRFYWFATLSLAVFLLLSAPFGIANLRHHGTFILSSNGGSFLFLNANSEVGYKDGVLYGELPEQEQYFVKNFSEYGEHFFGDRYKNALILGQKERQAEFRNIAWEWIKANPAKFLQLKWANTVRFLLPGKSRMHSGFREWLLSFLVGLPLYLLCYLGIGLILRSPADERNGKLWLLGVFIATAAALVLYLYTYRYKVYGIEFIYVVYAAHAAEWLRAYLLGKARPRSISS